MPEPNTSVATCTFVPQEKQLRKKCNLCKNPGWQNPKQGCPHVFFSLCIFSGKKSNYAKHLDIRLIPTESRVPAYFFYTSGGKFNQMIRQVAKDKGFMLSEFELKDNNIKYNQLVMGIERGPRYLINDMDPNKPGERAIAINVTRDGGIQS